MASGTSGEVRQLAVEIGRRIGNPGYRPRNEQDAIGRWIAESVHGHWTWIATSALSE